MARSDHPGAHARRPAPHKIGVVEFPQSRKTDKPQIVDVAVSEACANLLDQTHNQVAAAYERLERKCADQYEAMRAAQERALAPFLKLQELMVKAVDEGVQERVGRIMAEARIQALINAKAESKTTTQSTGDLLGVFREARGLIAEVRSVLTIIDENGGE